MPEINFSQQDKEQITGHGLTLEKVNKQVSNFISGFGFLPVESPAGIGNGILRPDENETERFISLYDQEINGLGVVKFVPASGAATRMFKDLFSYVKDGNGNAVAEKTIREIEKFAFCPALPDGIDFSDGKAVVESVLEYGAELPKALIYFHSYPDGPRTAFEEHLAEGAMYARSGDKVAIHFTISEEHRAGFEQLVEKIREKYGKLFGVAYDISFSVQNSGTDTIAVTPENQPFRNEDGTLLFRPAGHGALIENLNRIDADVIFIKNIDNVAPDRLKGDTVEYKKLIGGILLDLKKKTGRLISKVETGAPVTDADIDFIENSLCCKLPEGFDRGDTAFLLKILNRPLRVCGMVLNEGEPGGGPFWVKNSDGTTALQIAEPSQVAPEKSNLLKEGTHFNPVDIVCSVKNHKGEKFDLHRFVDPSTGFISEKSKDGKPLKAQELPGLWNGAMADWITVFAEVPVSTFSPVKEVIDLLRPEHQQ